MSDEASDDEMHDADLSSPKATENGDAVQYGELNVSSLDSVAVGVAAGNIHLQSANAATLALPEASQLILVCIQQSLQPATLHTSPPKQAVMYHELISPLVHGIGQQRS